MILQSLLLSFPFLFLLLLWYVSPSLSFFSSLSLFPLPSSLLSLSLFPLFPLLPHVLDDLMFLMLFMLFMLLFNSSVSAEYLNQRTNPTMKQSMEWNDSDLLLLRCKDTPTLQILSVEAQKVVYKIETGMYGCSKALWSPDGRHVLTFSELKVVLSLSPSSAFFLSLFGPYITSIPPLNLIFLWSSLLKTKILIWSLESKKCLQIVNPKDPSTKSISSIRIFSPKLGKTLQTKSLCILS